jgi:hypothetical protein
MRQESSADIPNRPGVYALRHRHTGTSYVGSAASVAEGVNRALQLLRTGEHGCAALQAAWNIDGAATFEYTVLELVQHVVQLPAAERYWLNTLCPLGLYNIDHHLHRARLSAITGARDSSSLDDQAHVTTSHLQVNAVTGVHRVVTAEECRTVYLARPLVRNVLRQVSAEAYLRAHPDSQDVMRSILEEWECQEGLTTVVSPAALDDRRSTWDPPDRADSSHP